MAWWSRRSAGDVVVFRREGGTAPPDHEVLRVTGDGRFTLWRSIGRSTRPPTPIGRFAGTVPAARWASLAAALDACRGAEAIELELPADAAREKVVLGRRTSTWADDATPPPPFAALAVEARRLLGELTAMPQAALAVPGVSSPELRHLGTEPLELDLSGAAVRVVHWEEDRVVGDWRAPLDGPRSVTAIPGWVFPLPFDHPFAAEARLTVEVGDVLVFDGEFWRTGALTSD